MAETYGELSFDEGLYLSAVAALVAPHEAQGEPSGGLEGFETPRTPIGANANLERALLEREVELLNRTAESDLLAYRIQNSLISILALMFVVAIGMSLFLLFAGSNVASIFTGLAGVADLAILMWITTQRKKARDQLDKTQAVVGKLREKLSHVAAARG